MALYDIIDEIAERQVTKSDTGDPRVPGALVGVVAKNYDKDMPGRVCVTIPVRENEANELQWVRLAHPSGGDSWGHYFLPEVGDQVLLVFEGGNIEKPYIVGCVAKDKDKFLSGSVDKDNVKKRIVTKHGSQLLFEDAKEGDGDKDRLTLATAKGQHTLLMDNDKGLIELRDQKGENAVVIKSKNGQMSVKAKSRLEILVGDGIKITMNGETGAINIDCKQLNVKAGQKVAVKTDGMLKEEAGQISAKASSIYKLESGGMVSIAGAPIKVG
ncbi:MAG: phage baseplate assembly protein V [Clostridiales Family XIII bacterium]|jgi:uncharacterized protein involved in type VI secretion and phage assembly|nr:phage baseplate assembly protein V [Clostridiales Family XIII bacterium]